MQKKKRLARHSKHWEDLLMTNPKTKASRLCTFLFMKGLEFRKIKMEIVTVICNSYLPGSSLLKLWFQTTLSITCHTCVPPPPQKLNRLSFFEKSLLELFTNPDCFSHLPTH